MVKFADTATNPEAMMVKLSHTTIAFPTVATSVWLDQLTNFTESFGWQFHFLDYKKTDKSEN